MSQFIYDGEESLGWKFVASYGLTKQITVPTKGGKHILVSPSGYRSGQIITDETGNPVEFKDEVSLRFLRSDPRFTEVK
jgi:hypothetical protein